MKHTFSSPIVLNTLRALGLASCLLAALACGDDAGSSSDGGGSSDASQEVTDACTPAVQKLDDAIVASGCGSNFDLLMGGCERRGAEAEDAGCLAEFQAEQACLADQIAEDACTCDGTSYGCPLPCLDEAFAREQCVDGK